MPMKAYDWEIKDDVSLWLTRASYPVLWHPENPTIAAALTCGALKIWLTYHGSQLEHGALAGHFALVVCWHLVLARKETVWWPTFLYISVCYFWCFYCKTLSLIFKVRNCKCSVWCFGLPSFKLWGLLYRSVLKDPKASSRKKVEILYFMKQFWGQFF